MSIVQPPLAEPTKKVGSDAEEYSDTAIESPNLEVNTSELFIDDDDD